MDIEFIKSFLKAEFPKSDIKFLSEGWWSYGFQIDDNIVRIPKTEKKGIGDYKKEIVVTDYLRDKVSVGLPKIKIIENSDFPYSIHKMLLGKEWTVPEADTLPEKKRENFIKNCVDFLNVVHSVPISEIKELIPDIKLRKVKLTPKEKLVSNVGNYFSDPKLENIYKKYSLICAAEIKEPVFLHGDFRGSNGLVNNEYRLTGVFDFGNACLGEREHEFIHLQSSENPKFLEDMLTEYKKRTGILISMSRIEDLLFAFSIDNCNVVANKDNMEENWVILNIKEFALHSN